MSIVLRGAQRGGLWTACPRQEEMIGDPKGLEAIGGRGLARRVHAFGGGAKAVVLDREAEFHGLFLSRD